MQAVTKFRRAFRELWLEDREKQYTMDELKEIFSIALHDEYAGMSDEFINGIVALAVAEYVKYKDDLITRRMVNEQKRKQAQQAKQQQQQEQLSGEVDGDWLEEAQKELNNVSNGINVDANLVRAVALILNQGQRRARAMSKRQQLATAKKRSAR